MYKIENKTIDIDFLQPNSWNPNKMDKATYNAEKESIQKYGVIAPIIVRPYDEGYEVVDGEHRLNVCYDLGHKKIPSIIIHDLEDKDAKKLTIILNETKGRNNKIELGKLLGEMKIDFGEDLKIGLPFNDEDINTLIDFGKVDCDKYEGGSIDDISEDEVLRLHLTFKGSDANLVKENLSENPEQKILELLKNDEG